jgi:nitronate monooxygenase
MPIQTAVTRQLQIKHPIVQAPMAGGGDTPQLVAAVSDAGGMGFIGAAYLAAAQILEVARAVRVKTQRPFGINLFAPLADAEMPADADRALKRVAPFFAELKLAAPELPRKPRLSFSEQLQAALQTDASVFSFTFGIFSSEAIAAIKSRGMLVWGTATTVQEAIALEKAGADAVIAQGSEAGGHRGTFLGEFSAGMIGTMALVPQIVDAVSVPVIASGGISDGRGIAAALTLGASAVQLGTSFLTCGESGVPEAYRRAILEAREDQTRITRAFSGRPARGIVNRFMTTIEGEEPVAILPFPMQNVLTRPLRNAARQQGRAEFLSLWAGQALRLATRESATHLVSRLAREAEEAIDRAASLKRDASHGRGAAPQSF